MNALPVSHPHYPSPRTMSLPPLSKGGGLTASHKLSLCCVLLATRPPFYSLNFSAVKTEGLLYHPSLSTTSMPSLVKGEVQSPEKFGRLPEGLYSVSTIILIGIILIDTSPQKKRSQHFAMTATYQIITLYNSAVLQTVANLRHFQRRNLQWISTTGGTRIGTSSQK